MVFFLILYILILLNLSLESSSLYCKMLQINFNHKVANYGKQFPSHFMFKAAIKKVLYCI